MKIGIYGGSFNPIHTGHTQLAASILQQGLVDELWLLVSPLNPLKQHDVKDIAGYDHRLRMSQLATEDIPGIRVSDFESHLPIPSYMVDTLAELSKAYPQHEFVLVIGADNWQSFPRWYHSEEILQRYRLLVYRRPGCEIDETVLPPSVQMVDTPLFDISSTQLRESFRKGTPLSAWMDAKVEKYILENKLFV